MPNRLATESSPYLLQHRDNPVDWHPWGSEALEKAKVEGKPIFLSIGYAACHWCHVMERESFEDAATAELMNRLFVSIKVDREERPDLDGIYMQAVVALTGQGGWPMSVFLTPEGEPFYGGTYYPPVRRYNMPSFKEVLAAIAAAWESDRNSVAEQASRIADHLRQTGSGPAAGAGEFDLAGLDTAALKLAQGYDWRNGGWGKAPKFPQPMAIEFLLRKATRGDGMALEIASHCLDAMAKGGMYDVVGGGFSRYSVDDFWRVPHFEKMLYDNAQLALVYLHAWLLTEKPLYRRVVEETLDFVMRELTGDEGGFYSSLDADSEGEEGKFYVWTTGELGAALLDPEEERLVTLAYGTSESGNFEGANVLQRVMDDKELAEAIGTATEDLPHRLSAAHRKMLGYRSSRVRPGTDDKCVTAWNGLMLAAFAEAGRYLKRTDYVKMAIRNGEYLLNRARGDGPGRLVRSWRRGQAGPPGFLEDYAAAALGLLALFQSDPMPRWFSAALALTDDMIALFQDPEGGFFDTGTDHETLILRPKDTQDNATPCGNSLAAALLYKMAAYTGESRYRELADQALSPIRSLSLDYPTAFANWLCAADQAVGPDQEVALTAVRIEELDPFLEVLWSKYRPRNVSAVFTFPPTDGMPALARNRSPIDGRPTAYVCRSFICRMPANSLKRFAEQLDDDMAGNEGSAGNEETAGPG